MRPGGQRAAFPSVEVGRNGFHSLTGKKARLDALCRGFGVVGGNAQLTVLGVATLQILSMLILRNRQALFAMQKLHTCECAIGACSYYERLKIVVDRF